MISEISYPEAAYVRSSETSSRSISIRWSTADSHIFCRITPGLWYQTGSTFQAVSGADKLSFVFRCDGSGVHNLISLDNVKVKPYAGNAF